MHCIIVNYCELLILHYSKLRTSEAGQMMLNLSIALLFHHATVFVFGTYLFIVPELQIPVLCLLTEALIGYTVLVIVFLMAAEALNAFFKIVLVFNTIDNYILKASIVAWSKLNEDFDIHF